MKFFAAFALLLMAVPAVPQSLGTASHVFVTALPPQPIEAVAGKDTVALVGFRVSSGMHVNAHKPTEDYLIPTTLNLPAAPGVQWGAVEYPAGELKMFAFSSTEKLSVYTGDIMLRVHLKAQPGRHTIMATLRYQACDNHACYPPKSLPVQVVIVAK